MKQQPSSDSGLMRLGLRLAQRAYGHTSPNPMVGAVLVKDGKIIGQGWHHRAGEPHAEIEALRDAERGNHDVRGAKLFVSLEPCSTFGRTPPCTQAIINAGIREVVVGATDPNPAHAGRGLELLRSAGIEVRAGVLAEEATRLNEAFNHWIVNRTPLVTVKAAMSLDGRIGTVTGESKWITGPKSRAVGMKLREGSDAILVGVNTVIKDNPSLTLRGKSAQGGKELRRIILDPTGRVALNLNVICDSLARLTSVVVGPGAAPERVAALQERVRVITAPGSEAGLDLPWLMRVLGQENVTALLVEGGGETNARFLFQGLAHRVAFFYAPIVLGGRTAPKGVAGDGVESLKDRIGLREVRWRKVGDDLLLTARVEEKSPLVQ